jgi:hypothetical protein
MLLNAHFKKRYEMQHQSGADVLVKNFYQESPYVQAMEDSEVHAWMTSQAITVSVPHGTASAPRPVRRDSIYYDIRIEDRNNYYPRPRRDRIEEKEICVEEHTYVSGNDYDVLNDMYVKYVLTEEW